MAQSRRVQRVEKELKQVIASYLLSGFKGPLPGIVSVAEISVNPDLRSAKVYISVLGSEEDRDMAEELLNDQAPAIQQHINRSIRMKFCPKLRFLVGQSPEDIFSSPSAPDSE